MNQLQLLAIPQDICHEARRWEHGVQCLDCNTLNCIYILGSCKGKWEACVIGQAPDQAQGKRQPRPDLLSDGQDVGHPG